MNPVGWVWKWVWKRWIKISLKLNVLLIFFCIDETNLSLRIDIKSFSRHRIFFAMTATNDVFPMQSLYHSSCNAGLLLHAADLAGLLQALSIKRLCRWPWMTNAARIFETKACTLDICSTTLMQDQFYVFLKVKVPHDSFDSYIRPGVSKLRPAGQMRPAKPFCQWWKNNAQNLRKICKFGRI